MKILDEPNDSGSRIHSEGKTLEVMPVLYDAAGQPMMLPAARWDLPNWALGYRDHHMVSTPFIAWSQDRIWIPGTNSASPVGLGSIVRVLERWPGATPGAGSTIDAVDAMAIIDAIRQATEDKR